MQLEDTLEMIEPGQDYEVVVDFKPDLPLDLVKFYQDLEAMGTSIQIGEGDGILPPAHPRTNRKALSAN